MSNSSTQKAAPIVQPTIDLSGVQMADIILTRND